MIDFDALEANVAADLNSDLIYAIVLGMSGGGKSRVCGTLPGKTLYLYSGAEKHGALSASAAGGKIVPVLVDFNYDKKQPYATKDEIYANTLKILKSHDSFIKSGFNSVVLDGLTEQEMIIRGTTAFKTACKTSSGGHNSFQEGVATSDLIRTILEELRNLQRVAKCHVAVTCILDVKAVGDKKEILESSPKLKSYGVAEGTVPMFDDILVVGRLQEDDEKPEYVFQMMGGVSKTSKEVNGRVKKTINYNPRISVSNHGVEIPEYIPANFAEILKIKQVVKGGKK